MINNTKQYVITVQVDEKQLIQSYIGGDETIDITQLPSIDELLAFELNWCATSGITVVEIEEVEE